VKGDEQMNGKMKILILEDSAEDVSLIERELLRAGMSFQTSVVNQRDEFEKALEVFRPDVILSDHSLPRFNSVEALKIYKTAQTKFNLAAPFILVTGAVSEEFAVQCIREGANDYILKDRLKRLPASIVSAIEKARIDAERIRYFNEIIANEAMLRQGQHLAKLGSWQADLITGENKWSDENFRLLGYAPGEITPNFKTFTECVHPDDVETLHLSLAEALTTVSEYENQFRIIHKDGSIKFISSKFIIQRDEDGQPSKLQGFLLDITEQKKYVQKIEAQNAKLKEIAWIQSHGVRAPLARILGLINLITTHHDINTDLNQILTLIVESVEELDNLVRSVVRKTEEITDL
jgi:PAS domain S-box-containing protein